MEDRKREPNGNAAPGNTGDAITRLVHISNSILNGADLNARVLPCKVIGKSQQAERPGKLAERMAIGRDVRPVPPLRIALRLPGLPVRTAGGLTTVNRGSGRPAWPG